LGGTPAGADESQKLTTSFIAIVEDNEALSRGVSRTLKGAGLEVACFESAEAFWDHCIEVSSNGHEPSRLACVILDLHLPGEGGLSVQRRLLEQSPDTPIVFMTGNGEVETAVRAMKRGAVDFLEKPFSQGELLEAVLRALERYHRSQHHREDLQEVEQRLARLTPRERQILSLLEADLPNKEIAHRLKISPRTVEVHRQRVMQKMEVDSVAGLVRLLLETKPR